MDLRQRATTSHGEIAFDVLGDGPPVVLVHGTPSRAAAWRDVAPALSAGHRVYVYDLLGFGESERRVEQDVSVARHGEVLAELIRLWGLDAPALIGHDIGGATVLRAHLVEGVPVSRLALIDAVVLRPWITPPTRSMQHDTGRYRTLPDDDLAAVIREHLETATVRRLPDDLYGLLFDQWAGADGQALYLRNIRWLDEADTDPVEQRLAALRAPVRVVWGSDDAWLPVSTSHRIAAAIGSPPPTIIEGAGHFSMLDRPDAVIAALREFLASRDGGLRGGP